KVLDDVAHEAVFVLRGQDLLGAGRDGARALHLGVAAHAARWSNAGLEVARRRAERWWRDPQRKLALPVLLGDAVDQRRVIAAEALGVLVVRGHRGGRDATGPRPLGLRRVEQIGPIGQLQAVAGD